MFGGTTVTLTGRYLNSGSQREVVFADKKCDIQRWATQRTASFANTHYSLQHMCFTVFRSNRVPIKISCYFQCYWRSWDSVFNRLPHSSCSRCREGTSESHHWRLSSDDREDVLLQGKPCYYFCATPLQYPKVGRWSRSALVSLMNPFSYKRLPFPHRKAWTCCSSHARLSCYTAAPSWW